MNPIRLALKVDCDTFEGTRDGIPNLLRLFDRYKIPATFFFTLGPDNSGRAALRVFTQKGFLKKMLRSNAVSMYGPRTMLSGTLLPGRVIGKHLGPTMLSVEKAGHEVGVHGWDHVRWHDRLDRLSREQILRDYGDAHALFQSIFNHPARASAAPGWHATDTSLLVQDSFNLLYAADTRLSYGPHLTLEEMRHRIKPEAGIYKMIAHDALLQTPQIPTTLPTWDEALGREEFVDEKALLNFYCKALEGIEVHTIHTEVEGQAHHALFERQIQAWLAEGVTFIRLQDIAEQAQQKPPSPTIARLRRIDLPGRGGQVTTCEAIS